MSEKVSKDFEGRLDAIDTRETLLQKKVAKLEERIDWLMKEREEKGIKNRWKWGLVLGTSISLINMILNLMGVV